VGVILRGGVVAAAVAAIALSVSTLTRNTVGGVAALLGYIAVSPAIGATLLRSFRPYDLTENMTVFANGGEVSRFVRGDDGYFQSVYAHGGGAALVIVLIYIAAAVAIAMAVFARRDID
jgi:ABC-type transport system involved in multi-copper enzyme maturation permease subunit